MLDNIYFCGVHKAGTTFFVELSKMMDMKVVMYEGLKKANYENYLNPSICIAPENTCVTRLCCDYQSFKYRIKKSNNFRAIYVYRDPRDIIVSTYHSWLTSHPGGHPERAGMMEMDEHKRWFYVIDMIGKKHQNVFYAIADWIEHCDDDRIMMYRFEDYFAYLDTHLRDSLKFLQLCIDVEEAYKKLSFSALSGGRKPGEIDNTSHYRSGTTTWKTELPDYALEYFNVEYNGLCELLGY